MKTKAYEQVEPDLSKMTFQEAAAGGPYTARDYIQWTFDELVELIRGFVYKMASPKRIHQDISRRFLRKFYDFFPEDAPCTIYDAPSAFFLVKNGEDWQDTPNVFEPDIFVVCDESKKIERGCAGTPDFVIEILSKSSTKRDQEIKFDLYEEYGVPEYWIVNPWKQHVLVNRLTESGKYDWHNFYEKDNTISPKQFPDLRIDLKDIFLEEPS